MKKLKVNENILALILLISFFLGSLPLVIAISVIWLFCDLNDSLKDLSIKVGVVFIAIAILDLGWSLIGAAKDLLFGSLNVLFEQLVSWGVDADLTLNTNTYLFGPINNVFRIVGYFVTFAILFVKLRFVVAVVRNEEMKGALWPLQPLIDKVNSFARNKFYEENKAPKAASASSFCNKCGAKADGKSPFCSSCGNKL